MAATSVMSLRTDQNPQASATVSTPPRWTSEERMRLTVQVGRPRLLSPVPPPWEAVGELLESVSDQEQPGKHSQAGQRERERDEVLAVICQ